MKFLTSLAFAALAAVTFLAAGVVQAAPPNEVRLNIAEQRTLTLPVNVSNTVYTARRYVTLSPVDGYVTGLRYVYAGPNAITSGTSNLVVKIGTVSSTVSVTVVSGTAALGTVSASAAPTSALRVNKGQALEVQPVGSPVIAGTLGGEGRALIEITPNYTPARFRQ